MKNFASVKAHPPRLAAGHGLRQWPDTQTFQDVVGIELRRRPRATARSVDPEAA